MDSAGKDTHAETNPSVAKNVLQQAQKFFHNNTALDLFLHFASKLIFL